MRPLSSQGLLAAVLLVIASPVAAGDFIVKSGGSFSIRPGASMILNGGTLDVLDGGLGEVDEGTIDGNLTVRAGGRLVICGYVTGDTVNLGEIEPGCDLVFVGSIGQAGGAFNGTLSRVGARNLYLLVLSSPSTVRFTDNLGSGVQLSLFAEDGSTFLGGTAGGGAGGNSSFSRLLPPGAYLIHVTDLGAASGDYNLSAGIQIERVQADALIGRARNRLIGKNVHNLTGARQSISLRVEGGRQTGFFFAGRNAGSIEDGLRIRVSTRRGAGIRVTQLHGGRANVSAKMRRGSYLREGLRPDQTILFAARYRSAGKGSRARTERIGTLVRSHFLADRGDRVLARVLPRLSTRPAGDSARGF